jgi:hypothetical protein
LVKVLPASPYLSVRHHPWPGQPDHERSHSRRHGAPADGIELLAAARIHWTVDEWRTTHDDNTQEIGFGIHLVDLPTQNVVPGARIRFTFYWHSTERWEGTDFSVLIDGAQGVATA